MQCAEIGYGFFIVEVIGDFPEEEARRFTEWSLAQAGKRTHLTDDDWHGVYEVRHGSRHRAATANLLFTTPAINCDEVSKSYMEYQPIVMLELCHSILQVCGGNAGQLGIAVLSYWGNWTTGALDHTPHPELLCPSNCCC